MLCYHNLTYVILCYVMLHYITSRHITSHHIIILYIIYYIILYRWTCRSCNDGLAIPTATEVSKALPPKFCGFCLSFRKVDRAEISARLRDETLLKYRVRWYDKMLSPGWNFSLVWANRAETLNCSHVIVPARVRIVTRMRRTCMHWNQPGLKLSM